MLILGLSPFEYDPAAVLLNDGVVMAGIEERKLARLPGQGLPSAAIQHCFNQAAVGWKEIEFIGCAAGHFRRWLRRSLFNSRRTLTAPAAGIYFEVKELGVLARELNHLRCLRNVSGAPNSRVLHFDHELCHAAAAFYPSPFKRALIVTQDEQADGLIAIGDGVQMRVLQRIPFPHSLAWLYSQIASLLGFGPQEQHKAQWLSLGGEPKFEDAFVEILRNRRSPVPFFDFSYFNRGLAGPVVFSEKFYRRLGLNSRNSAHTTEERQTLANSFQRACAKLVVDLVVHYCKREGIENVCLGGALFENTVLVADCEKKLPYELFVPPSPGNGGCAIGAASLVWHQVLRRPRGELISNVYWGPKYSRQEIKDVLDNCKVKYSCHHSELSKIDATVQLLKAGKIVGWYQGATEFGARALGNRSLLASPWADYVRENLNDYIKHREWFRPFALAVPEEDYSQFFDCSQLPRFMTSLAWARVTSDETLRGFFLPENRVRLHIVNRHSNSLFWRLLKRFGEDAPAPILVNTSFNLFGEPLVVSPRDAIRSFYSSGIDALMIDCFLVKKHNDVKTISFEYRAEVVDSPHRTSVCLAQESSMSAPKKVQTTDAAATRPVGKPTGMKGGIGI